MHLFVRKCLSKSWKSIIGKSKKIKIKMTTGYILLTFAQGITFLQVPSGILSFNLHGNNHIVEHSNSILILHMRNGAQR